MSENYLQRYKQQFDVNLDGIQFLKTYYDPSDKPTYEINTQHIDDAINVLKSQSVDGKRVLEIGCGPNVMNSLVTCSFFEEIYLSDYNLGMLKPLEDWMKGNTIEFDNTYIVNYVAKVLHVSPNELEMQVREKIKKILRCDIHIENPLMKEKCFFDAVVTRFCVDSCSPSLLAYNDAIKNIITSCIKQNGYFLQMGFFDHERTKHSKGHWDLGSLRVEDLRLTKAEIRYAVEDAGMEIVEWRERIHHQATESDFENTSSYTLLAVKRN